MTRREAAVSIICTYNWCSDCPMFLADKFKCLANKPANAELIRIARKEYKRKSKEKDGADYVRLVAKEWAIIGKGTTVI